MSHFLLAATGLVLWVIYVASDSSALAWIAFILLLVIAALGFTMFAAMETVTPDTPGEQHFPVAVVRVARRARGDDTRARAAGGCGVGGS